MPTRRVGIMPVFKAFAQALAAQREVILCAGKSVAYSG
jgi:hypothetical protein